MKVPDPVDTQSLASAIRRRRNFLLSESDWTQGADAPLSLVAKTQWAVYRNALRDITAQAGFPETVNWPQAPE